jgi:glutathione peroxidase
MSRFKDRKALLVVNLARKCDTTKDNVEGLNRLWNDYHDRGFEILGFPCNQFKSQ